MLIIKRLIQFISALIILLTLLFGINFIFQIYKKPIELISIITQTRAKTLTQTWKDYGEFFTNSSTDIISPAFLAALAQKESSGNPLASPRWKLNFKRPIDRIYSPPTTAFGLMQMTNPNFYDSSRLCYKAKNKRNSKSFDDCGRINMSTRIFPAHSIYLTARNLTYQVKKILKRRKRKKKATRDQIESLASITHLCGMGKGKRLLRSNFNVRKIGRCGSHSPINYVRDIKKLKKKFLLISKKAVKK
jgi:hypothetical protein